MIDRIPVHLRRLAVDEACFQEVQEHALLVLVIARIAGRDLAAPVDGKPHRLQLGAHGRDVGIGPFLRVDLVLHRGVFRRHAEGVPAHRMKHVEALGALVARHHVAHGVVAHVAHMDAPRRIGKHLEHVVFRTRVVVVRLEQVAVVPDLPPFQLGFLGVVALGPHFSQSSVMMEIQAACAAGLRRTRTQLSGAVNGFAHARWSRFDVCVIPGGPKGREGDPRRRA